MEFLNFVMRLVKRCVKRLTRLFTGHHEIERAAFNNNHRWLGIAYYQRRTLREGLSCLSAYGERAFLPTVQRGRRPGTLRAQEHPQPAVGVGYRPHCKAGMQCAGCDFVSGEGTR